MTGSLVTIIRDGDIVNIDEENLGKDDILILQTAEIVPADLKLIEANGLEVDEFEITGELLPVLKKVEEDVTLYKGSRIVKGTGKGVVLTTGEQTEFGRILDQRWVTSQYFGVKDFRSFMRLRKRGLPFPKLRKSPPFIEMIQRWEQNQPYKIHLFKEKYLGLVLFLLPSFIIQAATSKNIFGVIAFHLLLAFILILLQNNELFQYILVSNEVKKLENSKIQIRDIKTLERISRMDILCFDKTGVLTARQMDVEHIHLAGSILNTEDVRTIDESAFHWIKMACALCNDVLFFEKLELANPIDKALISFALSKGVDVKGLFRRSKRIYDQPFDSEQRYMVCGFELEGKVQYFAKGDPAVILKMCNRYMTPTGERKKMGPEFWSSNLADMQVINQSGNTALALAYTTDTSDNPPKNYSFLCLLQLENQLQPGVAETIKGVTEKGIRSILLTGDRAETAGRVAEECGIMKDSTMFLTGGTIERMALREVARQSSYCSVFARLIPSQKGVLIRLLQQKGHCVGMVGDGFNDGLALRVSDVGISFQKNSSPIARRFSKILIRDFSDLMRLIESAERIKWRVGQIKLLRIFMIAVSLISLYVWILWQN